ncbi:MAG: aldehyde dehydrogenase [Qipengyuania pacifica]
MGAQDKLFIGGQWVASKGSDWIEAVNPATEEVVGRVPAASTADIDTAVAAARDAFDNGPWPHMEIKERTQIINRAMQNLREINDEVAEVITSEMGSPITQSKMVQVPRAYAIWEYFAGIADSYPWQESRPTYDEVNAASEVIVTREPIGVVAAIVPWNGPLIVAAMKLAPALISGCTAVLKPSEEAALNFASMADVFDRAGLPAGVLNIVPADRQVSEYLVSHPGVDKVSLTGSTAAGRKIGSICGEGLRRFTLELGGKGVAMLLDDIDLDEVMAGLVAPMTFISGQACNAPTRILAPRSRYKEIADALAQTITALPFGDPMDPETFIGPLSSKRAQERVKGYLDLGKAEGARALIGGGIPADRPKGCYVEPTLFVDVDNQMRIAQEEIFGPVYCLIPYESEHEAVRIANDTVYGLESSVWTSNPTAGFKIARSIRCGTVGVNSHNLDMAAPFGGMKQSGLGRECGVEGISDYVEIKSIMPPVGTWEGAR